MKPVYLIAGALVAAAVVAVAAKKASGVASSVSEVVGDAVDAITPWNPENIFNRGVTAAGAAVTGNNNWSLGVHVYDETHKADGSFDWSSIELLTPAGTAARYLKRWFE